jgi:4-hydroxythreonine-4-phosphate dehydrogenase
LHGAIRAPTFSLAVLERPGVMALARIILTSGEPAGIGPDLCLLMAERTLDCDLVVAADRQLLEHRARQLGVDVQLLPFDTVVRAPHVPGTLRLLHRPLAAAVVPGRLDVRNAGYVVGLLDTAIDGCRARTFDGVVTAPVQKSILNDAGITFSGHTEYFAERTGTRTPVMLLTDGRLRVALATTHLPLAAVSSAITCELLERVLVVIDTELRTRFGLANPRVLVCGLNPHAGEGGHLGREELEVIAPTLARLRQRGMNLIGPAPADTAFTTHMLEAADIVLAMYHDQGLPVIKHVGFDRAVNVTLGLPIVRTSVDHGTALDLAGTGRADPGSLGAAVELAIELASRAQKRPAA